MTTNSKGPQWQVEEEFRQRVIRQALLLGFSARNIPIYTHDGPKPGKWSFTLDGKQYDGYGTLYGAAYDYCRLCGLPNQVIGEFRG